MGPSFRNWSPAKVKVAAGAWRFVKGQWRTSNIAAGFDAIVHRAVGQSTAVQVPVRCRLIGFTCSMSSLGTVEPVSGSALRIFAVRQGKTGSADEPVLIGTVEVGESNVSKDAAIAVELDRGDSVLVRLQTDASWTSTGCDPAITLEFEELEA
jgi:hypothetical protein